MEDDIQNYLSTVMFRGTPCTFNFLLIFSDKMSDISFKISIIWEINSKFKHQN